MNSNDKKAEQLGMPQGTASNRLRKSIIFNLLKETGKNFCYQCGAEIETEKELSIEHKIPYLDSEDPVGLFFDLENIAFSHLTCNVAAARPRKLAHPSLKSYDKGCRCDECRILQRDKRRKQRKRKKNTFEAHVEVAPDS